MTSQNSLGNIMSRLGGLKSVSGRRVKELPNFLDNLEDVDTDVSGTAPPLPNFSNFQAPQQNLPESDLGGELTPQSYDVRANTVIPPPGQEDGGMFSKLGRALADYVNPQKRQELSQYNQSLMNKARAEPQAPPIETAQVDTQEGLPPVTASQQEYTGSKAPETTPGILGAVADYFSPTKRDEMSQYRGELRQDAQLRAQGKEPGEVRNQVNQNFSQDIQKAMEQPWEHSAYGSAQEVANSPILQEQFKEVTGVNYEPQVAAQVALHEEAMKGVEDALNGVNTSLDERAEGIKQRILDNQSTDADKYYIGLALLLPLLIGGMFGKEAALGALGGGAKGIADVLGKRQKDMREDESSLLDINKQQAVNQEKLANIGLEKAKLGPALRKLLPENPQGHLEGMRMKEFTDANGKPVKAYEIKPGLVAKSQFVNSKEALTDTRKAANELATVKTFVKEVDDLTQDIAEIVTQLKDPTKAWKGFASIMKDKVPGSLSALTQDVMFEGRMQNAGTILEEKLGFLANAYGMAKEIGQLDRAAQTHIKKIIENPTSTLLTPRDSLSQLLQIRKLAQKGLIESAKNQGFYEEPLIEDLSTRNKEFLGGLNKSENDKRLAERKKQAMQSETNYAK